MTIPRTPGPDRRTGSAPPATDRRGAALLPGDLQHSARTCLFAVSTDHVDDDETMTEAEIDAEFERTQPIGHAINALAQAEAIIARIGD